MHPMVLVGTAKVPLQPWTALAIAFIGNILAYCFFVGRDLPRHVPHLFKYQFERLHVLGQFRFVKMVWGTFGSEHKTRQWVATGCP